MAAKGFPAPSGRSHTLALEPGHSVVVTHAWTKELGHRARLLLGGVLLGGLFGWPWFVLPDELGSIRLLFAGVGGIFALLFVGTALLAPVRRFHIEVRPGEVQVHRAPGVASGRYPASQVRGVVSTAQVHEFAGPQGAEDELKAQGRGASRRLGLHIEGIGTLGLLHTDERARFEHARSAVQSTLGAGRDEPIPVWRVAPSAPGHPSPPVDREGRPMGWPVHPRIGVEMNEARCAFTVPAPSRSRRWASYALGASPLIAVLAGLAGLALWGPGGSWNPFMVLADPDVLVLAIVGTWLAMGLYPAKRLVAWLHRRVAHGPYHVVLNEEALLVLGAGREVIERVPVDQVLGFEVTQFGLKVLTPGKPVRLPVYALASREHRAWLQAGLVYALDRWSGHRLPELDLAGSPSSPARLPGTRSA